ncbi:MAG: ABC transporter ATP-binding protein [Spirochaetales bacterium]|nr:ABC transporter ATP-binding protein [Spirochaetales bacterium]
MKIDNDINPVIETKALTKYYGKARGIENVNIRINKGEIFGFIGPNGAGKSTTIRTLLGLIFPSSGRGEIFGLDIVKNKGEIRNRIGYMPSDVNYYPALTCRELLAYSARFCRNADPGRIGELAACFELDLARKFSDLSMGNKKKVTIIQAFLHSPELLILDEPTTGLDPLMQKRFFDLLHKENKKGTTVFFSSHTLSEVQKLCERVAIIREGTIIKTEDVKDLRARQIKKVRIDFRDRMDGRIETLDGVKVPQHNGNTLSFFFSGDINLLIRQLSKCNVENMEIMEPDLEEIFLHYYEKGEEAS